MKPTLLIVVILGLSAGQSLAIGPVRLPPSKLRAESVNGRFIATVIPAGRVFGRPAEEKQLIRPRLNVYEKRTDKEDLIWSLELMNTVSPDCVFISDDGKNVVTLRDWAKHGDGPLGAVFYEKDRTIKAYSLAETLGISNAEFKNRFGPWVSPSTEIRFLRQFADKQCFCIWLPWDRKWRIWNVSDGDLCPVTEVMAASCNEAARAWARNAVASCIGVRGTLPSGEQVTKLYILPDALEAYDFLAVLHDPEDRKIFENSLQVNDFKVSDSTVGGRARSPTPAVLVAHSEHRALADQVVANWGTSLKWGDLFSNPEKPRSDFQLLGNLSGKVRLPAKAAAEDGSLWLTFLPQDHHSPHDKLSVRFPFDWASGSLAVDHVAFEVNGLLPGKYKVEATWDRSAPFAGPDAKEPDPGKGDFQSIQPQTVTIEAGKRFEGLAIECGQAVE